MNDYYEGKTGGKKRNIRLGGIGLKNVEQRIELLCGKGYGLNITSAPGKGTEVKIKVKG